MADVIIDCCIERIGVYKVTVTANNRNFSILCIKQKGEYRFVLAKDLDNPDNCYLTESEHNDLVSIIKANANPNLKELLQLT